MTPYQTIHAKKKNRPLSQEEITEFVFGYMDGFISEAQMAAFLMAVRLNGMNDDETFALTVAMAQSGLSIDTSELDCLLDKHSTGGVGDKTTFLVASMLAAMGYNVGMMSGRGLGHTGGTIDKLESISGFTAVLSSKQYIDAVNKTRLSIISQSADIAPADKRMYELRNMTATIDSVPLIAASIMSKKIASGSQNIVLDVKYGPAAFLKEKEEAKELSELMTSIGEHYGMRVASHLTYSADVLGEDIGNATEIAECVKIMSGVLAPGSIALVDLSVELASLLIGLIDEEDIMAKEELLFTLYNGSALDAFYTFLANQSANLPEFESLLTTDEKAKAILSIMPMPDKTYPVYARHSGIVKSVDVEEIGMTVAKLGANRFVSSDVISHDIGLHVNVHIGDTINENDVLAIIEYRQDMAGEREGFEHSLQSVAEHLTSCWKIA